MKIAIKTNKLPPVAEQAKAVQGISLSALIGKTQFNAPAQTSDSRILHGTGLTARDLERSEAKGEAQAEKAAQLKPEAIVPVITLDVSALPSTITDAGLQLDPTQALAVSGIKGQQFACLVGAAGTGKTTTNKAVIAAIESTIPTIDLNLARRETRRTDKEIWNLAICIVSFTGRAVQQIKRALPEAYHPMCRTAHATLGYGPVQEPQYDSASGQYIERRVFRPFFTASNPLPFKVCVIDEAGMMPITLWNELIAALPADCRIILMGDINQLPPVQGRSVLGFAMTKWPTFVLDKLHRNAGVIAQNAHRVLEGKNPVRDPASFVMMELPGGGWDTLNQVQAVVQTLHKQGTFNPMTDALIVPQNIGPIGQETLNGKLVHYFNPEKRLEGVPINKRTTIHAGRHTLHFAIGDKVMIKANDEERGITNGMCGIVTDICVNAAYKGQAAIDDLSDLSFDMDDLNEHMEAASENPVEDESPEENVRQASHITTVQFQNVDEPVVFQTVGEYKDFAHAYAFTCHKTQGGEYPTVVIVVHSANSVMLTREWLYTAITRAQKRVVLLYNARGLHQAITRQTIKGNTVAEKAASFLALQDKSDTTVPMLPAPKAITIEEKQA